jgi:formylglycine-generating enzyme required for sulfatase activity
MGSFRVDRGGSWDNDAAICRSAIRSSIVPTRRTGSLGFRLALSFVGVPDKPGKEKR